MPEITTFTSLKADVVRYLERGGSAISDPNVFDQIPRLINAAERNICQELKLQGQIEVLRDLTGLRIGVPILTKPDRWRQTASMNFGTGATGMSMKPLFPRSYEYLRTYWPDQSVTAEPEFYAEYDYQHYLIAPTPDATYPLELIAYMQPQLLDTNNQTNFFTIWTPNLLLYGTLLEASPFLKNDDRIPVWRELYDRNASTLAGQDLQKILDRAVERKKP